jgi:hypothetical protein
VAAYAAIKAALRELADSLREEKACHGLRVTTIYPGGAATERLRRVRGQFATVRGSRLHPARGAGVGGAHLCWSKTRPLVLSCAWMACVIGVRVRQSCVPIVCLPGLLAGITSPLVRVEGRGNTRVAARARSSAPSPSEAETALEGSGCAVRACTDFAQGAAGAPHRHPGHVAALASPAITARCANPRQQGVG